MGSIKLEPYYIEIYRAGTQRLKISRPCKFGLKSTASPPIRSVAPTIPRRKMAASGDCSGLPTNFTEVILVRHGETAWNASRILQGQIDSELNDIGRKQAVAVGSHLSKEKNIAAIYSSDLKRATETARIIASSCNLPEVILDPSLRERHIGDLQGLTLRDAEKQKPIAYKHFLSAKRDQEIPGGGESLVQLRERCAFFLKNLARKHKGQRIIVVTHGGFLEELYRGACPTKLPNRKIKNTSISVIHVNENSNEWTVKKWADVGHLRDVVVKEDAFGGDGLSG